MSGKELDESYAAGSLEGFEYMQWLSNMVLVSTSSNRANWIFFATNLVYIIFASLHIYRYREKSNFYDFGKLGDNSSNLF